MAINLEQDLQTETVNRGYDIRIIPKDRILPEGYVQCSMWGCKNMFRKDNPPIQGSGCCSYECRVLLRE